MELIYTSAPRGLNPSQVGYCTVAASPNMPGDLVEKLESLSVYNHPPGNPVAFGHYRLRLGSRRYHVLSRIADAGADYTGRRNNYIAHHVVVEGKDLTPGGPAAVLSDPQFLAKAWQGEPRHITESRSLPPAAGGMAVCSKWGERTGDPGWGGVIAETILSGAEGSSRYIIFSPEIDVLPLLVEALNLLPPEKRWDATFCTYYTNQSVPSAFEPRLKFVLQNTTEATLARRSSTTIDLTAGNLGPAAGGALVEAARTGALPAKKEVAPDLTTAPEHSAASDQPAAEQKAVRPARPQQLEEIYQEDDFTVPPDAPTAWQAPYQGAYQVPAQQSTVQVRAEKTKAKGGIPWWYYAGGAAVLLGLGLAAILIGDMLRGSTPAKANPADDPNKPPVVQGPTPAQLEAQRKEKIRRQVQEHIEEIKQLAGQISELAGRARNHKNEIDKLAAASASVRTDERNIQAEFDSAGNAEKQKEFLDRLRKQAQGKPAESKTGLEAALQDVSSLGVKANGKYTQAITLLKELSKFDAGNLQRELDNAVYPATEGRKDIEALATEGLQKIGPAADKLAAARLIITRLEGQIQTEVKPEVHVVEGNPFREMKPYASLPLPSTDLTDLSAGNITLIGPLQGLPANKLNLELIGGSVVLQPNGTFTVVEVSDGEVKRWDVMKKGVVAGDRIGNFFVDPQGLKFRWKEGIDGLGDEKKLQNCRLRLASGEHRWELQLSKPRSIPLTLAFENVPLFFVEGFQIPPMPESSQIVLFLQLHKVEGLSHANPLLMPIPVKSNSEERRAGKNLFEGTAIKENELTWLVETIVTKTNAPPSGSQVMQLKSEFRLPGYKGDYINRTSDAVQLAQLASISNTMKINGDKVHAEITSKDGLQVQVNKQEEALNGARRRLAEAKKDAEKKAIKPQVEEAEEKLNSLKLKKQRKEAERDENYAVQKMADRGREIIQKIKDGGQLVITVKARIVLAENKFYDVDLIRLDSPLEPK